MKKLFYFSFLLITLSSFGQEIVGSWYGSISVQGTELRLVFNINKTETGYSSTMDSPDQGASGIPVTSTSFENNILKIEMTNLRLDYVGELKNGVIKGNLKQRGISFPIDLSKNKIEKTALANRPQEPTKPYAYYSEDVTFQNSKANISLAGTLTLPSKEGVFPVVILISGSGPQNRDEELLGHKPFLIISDYLTKNGIAVLRFDDRGVAQSKGDFKNATSLDFASDVEAAVSFLLTRKEINKAKIGLIGHSEGGLIAPMIAAKSKDINFIVLLAGPGIPGDEILLLQQELIARVSGASEAAIEETKTTNKKAFEILKKSSSPEALNTDLMQYFKETEKNKPDAEKTDDATLQNAIDQLNNPWMQYFIKYNPATSLEKVKCAVLALNGEKDLQVPPKENLAAIKKSLEKSGNKKFTVKELPGLNHLFQECKTGSPEEYATIEQTFSPIALKEVSDWILNQVKK